MKNVLYIAMFGVAIMCLGCSFNSGGTPSGAFPQQVGPFKLSSGPDAESGSQPPHYRAVYKSLTGKEVRLEITVFPSDDAAKKADDVDNENPDANGDSMRYKEGDRVIAVDKAGKTHVNWRNKTWRCVAFSDDQAMTFEFINSLSYK